MVMKRDVVKVRPVPNRCHGINDNNNIVIIIISASIRPTAGHKPSLSCQFLRGSNANCNFTHTFEFLLTPEPATIC